MDFIRTYGKEIVSILVPFITWLLNVGLKGKAKLVWTARHSFSYLVQEPILDSTGAVLKPTQTVHTASIRVINTGRQTSTKVELVFNWKPQHLNLWPVRHYEQKTDSDRRHMLIFENLTPREEIGIEIMSINGDLPGLLQVRSAECIAREVEAMWIARIPKWKLTLCQALLIVGLITTTYWILAAVQLLILNTPPAA
jgi:hypothetical protein